VALKDLDASYTSFFRGLKDGSIAQKKNNYIKNRLSRGLEININKLNNIGKPNFKSKKDLKYSFNCPQNFKVAENKLYIPKLKTGIEIVLHRRLPLEQRNVTISKTSTGKYFASILCETGEKIPSKKKVKKETSVGLDLGIKDFAVLSDGTKIDNPRHLKKSINKLKYIQHRYSKNKGVKTKYRLSLLHEKVANQRKDFLHKLSNEITNHYNTICLEDLNIKGMVKNHKLAQSISDVGWGMFVDMIKYKSEWKGKNVLQIGMFEPSSKTCNTCYSVNKELTLKDRTWTCKSCNTTHDRDENASKNIRDFALKNHLSGEHTLKNRNELPTLVGVLTSEA
jgi:putative transposase